MRHNDKQYGTPFVEYTDTKANIEALTSILEGAHAYATDTNQPGWYDGTIWNWGSGGESILHLYNEDLTSQIPATEFTTSKVYSSGTLRVYYNGLRQIKGIHYLDDVEFTTFSTYFVTYSGDSLVVDYDYLESAQTVVSSSGYLVDSDGILIVDSDGIQLTDS
jgi:hypothetical protein